MMLGIGETPATTGNAIPPSIATVSNNQSPPSAMSEFGAGALMWLQPAAALNHLGEGVAALPHPKAIGLLAVPAAIVLLVFMGSKK